MGYRKCPNHGWLETAEYAVNPSGETVCPSCEIATHGFYEDFATRCQFGNPGGPNHHPREEFVKVNLEYLDRTEELSYAEYCDVAPVMDDYDFPESVAKDRDTSHFETQTA